MDPANIAQQQQEPHESWWSQGWLMYAFASSNLALVLLIGWSQRRTLRRSAQLTGLSRLLGCAAGLCCSGAGGDGSALALAAAHRRARLYQQAAAGSQLKSAAAAAGTGPAAAPTKMSSSNQSLFLVSSAQRQHLSHHLASQSVTYQQPTYGLAAAYLASSGPQQHIYDSTSALNNNGATEQLNVMQLMHQQQQLQQLHRQEQFATIHGARQHQQQAFHLQHQAAARHQPMTLRAAGFESRNQQAAPDLSSHPLIGMDQVCQRQQQQTGEADGPLVAFSSCSSSDSSSQQANQHQQQQQQATFGPPLTSTATSSTSQQQPTASSQISARLGHPSGPQLFDYQQQQQHHLQCSRQQQQQQQLQAASVPTQQQHQYYSINSPASGVRPHNNANQQPHFRSRQQQQQGRQMFLAPDGQVESANVIDGAGMESNIYDVANYALIP